MPRDTVDKSGASIYSRWHRDEFKNGPRPDHYMMDIDSVEVAYLTPTEPVIAAIMEIKRHTDNLTTLQSQLYPKIAAALDAPFYVVYHNLETEPDQSKWFFRVHRPADDKTRTFFSPGDYVYWLAQIRQRKLTSISEQAKIDSEKGDAK